MNIKKEKAMKTFFTTSKVSWVMGIMCLLCFLFPSGSYGTLDKDLITAVSKNDVKAVQRALKDGFDVNADIMATGFQSASLSEGRKSTGFAINYGGSLLANAHTVEMAGMLLEHGADVNAENSSHATVLMSVVINGDVQVAQLLLEHGADVNAAEDHGMTALMFAAYQGRADIVKLLLEHGADVNAKNNDGWSAAMFAKSQGHAAVLVRLKGKATPDEDLLYAARYGDLEMAKNALKKGANPKAKHVPQSAEQHGDMRGFWRLKSGVGTALMLASSAGHSEVARLLIEHGADVNAVLTTVPAALKDGAFSTGRTFVSYNGQIDLKEYPDVTELLGKQQPYEKGWTSLMFAAYSGRTEVVKLLLERGAEVDAEQREGWTALLFAAYRGHADVVKLLLQYNANIGETTQHAQTPLIVAAYSGHIDVARILFEHQGITKPAIPFQQRTYRTIPYRQTLFWKLTEHIAQGVFALRLKRKPLKSKASKVAPLIEMRTSRGETAFWLAAVNRHLDFAGLLLEYGADINIANELGQTALMRNAMYGRIEVAKFLIEKGIHINAKIQTGEYQGWTALKFAEENEEKDMVRFLREAGAR